MWKRVKDPASEESQNDAAETQEDIAFACEAAVIGLIAKALADARGMTPAEVVIRSRAFENEANKAINRHAKKAKAAAKRSVLEMADGNEAWAQPFFKAKGIEQVPYAKDAILSSIVDGAVDDAVNAVGDAYETSALGIVRGNKVVTPREAYVSMMNDASAAARAGDEAFTAALRRSVDSLAKDGLRVVEGTDIPKVRYRAQSRELYSAARMNFMGAYRSGMQAMRDEQGRQFGADGVEVSAHALCAEDHLKYQGKQYTNREFERIQASLPRPLVTGPNCGHMTSSILLGISVPAYSDEELERMRERSSEDVTFKGVSGKKMTMSRYDASQYQRQLESKAREYATRGDMEEMQGLSRAATDKALERVTAAYNRMCDQLDLTKRRDRMRSYFAS